MKYVFLTFAAGCALALGATNAAAHDAPAIDAAIAASDRPTDARALDEGRKPAEVLAFLGLEPGMTAADLMTGAGYWAELMGHVVGDAGVVVAFEPEQFAGSERAKAYWAALQERVENVDLLLYPFDKFAPPANKFDFALINLSYHDLYWESEKYKIPLTDPDAYVAALFAGMKPGGIVGVIDHTGSGDDTRALVDKTHRIDPAVVKADFERAGFVLVGKSDALANPDDDQSVNVFEPSIRGKTDRFVMKFVKPL